MINESGSEYGKLAFIESENEFVVSPFPATYGPVESYEIWAPGTTPYSEGYALSNISIPNWTWLAVGVVAFILLALGLKKKGEGVGLITKELPEFLGIE